MEVIPIVAMYGKKIMDFDKDGPEFKRAVSDFEKQFRPGENVQGEAKNRHGQAAPAAWPPSKGELAVH